MFKLSRRYAMPSRSTRNQYPWGKMKIGDSFLVPKRKTGAALYTLAKKAGIRIATRVEKKGLRVWRVK